MKKIVLTLVLGVFAFGASAQTFELVEIGESTDCAQEAWEAGTQAGEEAGGLDTFWGSVIAYVETEVYFQENCL